MNLFLKLLIEELSDTAVAPFQISLNRIKGNEEREISQNEIKVVQWKLYGILVIVARSGKGHLYRGVCSSFRSVRVHVDPKLGAN